MAGPATTSGSVWVSDDTLPAQPFPAHDRSLSGYTLSIAISMRNAAPPFAHAEILLDCRERRNESGRICSS